MTTDDAQNRDAQQSGSWQRWEEITPTLPSSADTVPVVHHLLFNGAGEGSEGEPELGDRGSVPIRIRR